MKAMQVVAQLLLGARVRGTQYTIATPARVKAMREGDIGEIVDVAMSKDGRFMRLTGSNIILDVQLAKPGLFAARALLQHEMNLPDSENAHLDMREVYDDDGEKHEKTLLVSGKLPQ